MASVLGTAAQFQALMRGGQAIDTATLELMIDAIDVRMISYAGAHPTDTDSNEFKQRQIVMRDILIGMQTQGVKDRNEIIENNLKRLPRKLIYILGSG